MVSTRRRIASTPDTVCSRSVGKVGQGVYSTSVFVYMRIHALYGEFFVSLPSFASCGDATDALLLPLLALTTGTVGRILRARLMTSSDVSREHLETRTYVPQLLPRECYFIADENFLTGLSYHSIRSKLAVICRMSSPAALKWKQ